METSTTPRRSSRRSSSFSSSNQKKESNKNPYAMSGLDKFSALLAELEEKKQKIYSQVKNPDEISLVRFVYKDSDDYVPIVVKMKNRDKQQEKDNKIKQSPPRNQDPDHHHQMKDNNKFSSENSSPNSALENEQVKKSWRFSFAWSEFLKRSNWRQPCYYLPGFIVLILLFLVFFGRSFAILCTSIGWYIVPTLQTRAADQSTPSYGIRRPMKKKEYIRIYSDNKIVTGNSSSTSASKTSTNNNNSGNLKKHGHQKSW